MIGQDYQLDHEKPEYGPCQIKLLILDGHHNRDRHQNISEKYGAQRNKKGFSFGMADSQGKSLADKDKIDHTENGTHNQSFTHRFVTGQKKTKPDSDGDPDCPGSVTFLGLFNRFHFLGFLGRCLWVQLPP